MRWKGHLIQAFEILYEKRYPKNLELCEGNLLQNEEGTTWQPRETNI
jgi:hypothetical protein